MVWITPSISINLVQCYASSLGSTLSSTLSRLDWYNINTKLKSWIKTLEHNEKSMYIGLRNINNLHATLSIVQSIHYKRLPESISATGPSYMYAWARAGVYWSYWSLQHHKINELFIIQLFIYHFSSKLTGSAMMVFLRRRWVTSPSNPCRRHTTTTN